MKWGFIVLLLANALYLGWEIDRDARLARNDAAAVIRVPPGTPRLELLSEPGPVTPIWTAPVRPQTAPIKARGEKFGHSK